MDPILTLPTTAVGDIMAFAGELFTNTWALIAVAIGLPVAFWVVNKLIGMVRGGLRARS